MNRRQSNKESRGHNPEASIRRRLIGAWKLLTFEIWVDGNVLHPYGEYSIGPLTYDEAGRMSAHVMKPGRKSSITDPIAVTSASCDELRQIADGYVGYYGTFSIDEESKTVIHHVEVAIGSLIGVACFITSWAPRN